MVSKHGVLRPSKQALLVASTCAILVGGRAINAQPVNRLEDGRLAIAVVARPWALSLALAEVSRFCECVIDYEEPDWAWRGDLETPPVARGRSVGVPRRTTLRLTDTVSDPLTPDDTGRVVARLVAQFERQTSARFEVRAGRPLRVVPTSVRGADGRPRRSRPLMDTPISVSGPPVRPSEWLVRIATALSRATGRDVRALMQGNQVNYGTVTGFEARDEPASSVFIRLYAPVRPAPGWVIGRATGLGWVTLALRTPQPRHLSLVDPNRPHGDRER